jgi:hypothetical protein
MKEDEGIQNCVCEEEKLLDKNQADNRYFWCDEVLEERPHSEDWKDVAFSDEYHLAIGPQITKRVKRPVGKEWRRHPANVHRKRVTSKDTKAKAREEKHLKLFNVHVVVLYNWRFYIRYTVGNSVGKMTTKCYIEQILPVLEPELKKRGITLCQDADSVHRAKATIEYCAEHNIPLTLPGNSPDLSIWETQAQPLKRRFHARRSPTEEAAFKRFEQLFGKEMDQSKIQYLYNSYTAGLHKCKRAGGQMTHYPFVR